MLSALLMACVLLRPACIWCGPSPTTTGVTVSPELDPPPAATEGAVTADRATGPALATSEGAAIEASTPNLSTAAPGGTGSLAQVMVELAGFYESTIRSATAASQAELAASLAAMAESQAEAAKSLRSLQEGLTTVSGRLDAVQDSHAALQKTQRTLSSRLDSIQETLGDVSGRFEVTRELSGEVSHVASSREANSALSARLDSLLESQGALSGRLDTIRDSQAALSQRLDALTESQSVHSGQLAELVNRVDAMQASQSALSSRVDALLQSQSAAAGGESAVCNRLNSIQAAVSRIPWRVLGEPCRNDSECSEVVPEAVCGSERLCVCEDGFRRVSGTVCRRNSRLSETCGDDADCEALTLYAVCAGGVCACQTDRWNHNDTQCWPPHVGEGGSCTDDRQCLSGLTCLSGACSCPVTKHGPFEYRLAGDTSCDQGRIELRRLGGSWGLVCDDDWGSSDASVACRSLGLRGGVPKNNSAYGRGTNFYMDNVSCGGTESSLVNCQYNDWGLHNCGGDEVAGVICSR